LGSFLVVVALLIGVGVADAQIVDTTIYAIQQGMQDGSVLPGDSVRVTSVVVIGVDVRPSTFGVYIQEQGGGAWSGILAYRSSNFPAYENTGDAVQIGDVIDVEGEIDDFNGLSEIGPFPGNIGPRLTKSGTTTPLAPEVLPPDSLSNGYPGAERWEGVLVQVQNVVITSVNEFNNWYFLTSTGIDSLSGYEKMFSGQVVPQVGDTLATATGVGDWAFSERRIAPRSNDDIVFASPAPAPAPNLGYSSSENQIKVRFNVELDEASAEDELNYSLSTPELVDLAVYTNATQTVTLTTSGPLTPSTTPVTLSMQNILNSQLRIMDGVQTVEFIGGIASIPFIQDPIAADNDTSKVNNQQVSLRGVVTGSSDGVDYQGALGGFFVQDPSATEYAGIFVFGSPITPSRNDEVFVSGVVSEFGVGPQTEIVGVDEVTILGVAAPVAPIVRTIAQINGSDPAEGEKYESTLVQVQNVYVEVDTFVAGEPFTIVENTAPNFPRQYVGDLAQDDTPYTPWHGDQLTSITGIMHYSGTEPFLRMHPRNWNVPPAGDIEPASVSSDAVPRAWVTELVQNEPNPFNPATTIRFTVGRAGHTRLRVFDLRGRLVVTLIDQEMPVGPDRVTWTGLDSDGRRVGSGLYFYRLITQDQTITRKMLLLK
jgi:predicted extracellular nuclease